VDFAVSCVLLLADGEVVVLMGNPHLTEHVAGRDHRVSAESFFQVNTAGAEVLVALVAEALAPSGTETLLDLYSGGGLFGLALAGEAGRVIAIESDPNAVADFRHNVRALDGVELIEGDVEAVLPTLSEPIDLLVLDPPRSGAGRVVVAGIAGLAPRHIAYVSCDPATLARDARGLVKAGYLLQSVQPVDLFPQTYHIESVALFARQDRAR
jgi:23S rRNA (uracil1939-C5)-methyltransferase